MKTASDESPVPGYLWPHPDHDWVALMIPCPCGRWHTHGAAEDEIPGVTTDRVPHCHTHWYGDVTIQSEPFRARWKTRSGHLSAAYRRFAVPCHDPTR